MKKKSYGKKLLAWVLALAVSMTLVPVMGQREVQAAKIMNAWDGETTEVPKTDENGITTWKFKKSKALFDLLSNYYSNRE